MNELSRLSPPAGARTKANRVGRGVGSGNGKTAGRGQKGQKARRSVPRGFEGGQMPLSRRLPKVGFKNIFREDVAVVNVSQLDRFADGDVVDGASLASHGLLRRADRPVKLLGHGDLAKKLTVRLAKVSAGARQKIEAAGGVVEVIGG